MRDQVESGGGRSRIFYCPDIRWEGVGEDSPAGEGVQVDLPDEEARHALRVLRLGRGAALRLFDGRGFFYEGHIVEARRDGCRVALQSRRPGRADPRHRLTLAVAQLKGKKAELLVQKAVELGVSRLLFFPAARSVPRPTGKDRAGTLERWEKIAIGACKQCGRAREMELDQQGGLEELLADWGGTPARRLVFREGAGALDYPDWGGIAGVKVETLALIGPEGGWEEREILRLDEEGFQAVSLGRRILRAETAALCAATLILAAAGEMNLSGD